jgi:hypothetical protein
MIGGKGESWESRTKSSFIPGVADAGYQLGKGLTTAGKDIVTGIGKEFGKAGDSALDYGKRTAGSLLNTGDSLLENDKGPSLKEKVNINKNINTQPKSALSKVISGGSPFITTEQDSTFSPAMTNTEDWYE